MGCVTSHSYQTRQTGANCGALTKVNGYCGLLFLFTVLFVEIEESSWKCFWGHQLLGQHTFGKNESVTSRVQRGAEKFAIAQCMERKLNPFTLHL